MHEINIFAIVPVEVLADKRLTLKQMRVLIGLLSFRAKNSDTVWPKREQLAERCGGMAVCQISTATTELCGLGWLVKEGQGGKSCSSKYKITVPDFTQTVTESVTVTECETVINSVTVIEPVTVTDSVTQTVTESVTLPHQTVTESVRGKEHTIKPNRQNNRPITPHAMLATMNISAAVAADWILIREKKKAAITQTALDGILREAGKANLSLEDALRICCERGWSGFSASWLVRDSPAPEGRKTPKPENFATKNYGEGITAL